MQILTAAIANCYALIMNSDLALSSPLPIQLVDFRGEIVDDAIIFWETAWELNNDFFTVERSEKGEVFTSIDQVNGNGTTTLHQTYSLVDSNPLDGRSYYRLKQTDFDETITYLKVISINYEGSTFATMNVYPNLSTGRVLL